jgi:hypothetical protein
MMDHYLDNKKEPIKFYLDQAESLVTLLSCCALLFNDPVDKTDKIAGQIAALAAGVVVHQSNSFTKALAFMATQENNVKHLCDSFQNHKKHFTLHQLVSSHPTRTSSS